MNKFHYFIILLTFVIYGFIFYQRDYAGPDVVDYFRNISSHSIIQLTRNSFIEGREYQIYSDYNSTLVGLTENGLKNPYYKDKKDVVYFNKDKSKINLSCNSVTDYGEIIGTISIGNDDGKEYFYYNKLKSIYAYNTSESKDKGMKVKCYPVK